MQCENLACDEENVYFYSESQFSIIRLKRKNGNMYAKMIPKKYFRMTLPFRAMTKREQKLYLLPFCAREICVYDIEKDFFYEIILPGDCYLNEEKYGVMAAVSDDDKIYMFGYYPVIIVFHVLTEEIFVLRNWEKGLTYHLSRSYFAFSDKGVINKGKLYLIIDRTNVILEMDVITYAKRVIKIQRENFSVPLIAAGIRGSFLWAVPQLFDNKPWLAKIDLRSGEMDEVPLDDIEYYSDCFTFHECGLWDNEIWMLPMQYDKGYRYNIITGKLVELKVRGKRLDYIKDTRSVIDYNYLSSIVAEGNHVLSLYNGDGSLVDIDMMSGNVKEVQIQFMETSEFKEAYMTFLRSKKDMMYEEKIYGGLKFLIDSLAKS